MGTFLTSSPFKCRYCAWIRIPEVYLMLFEPSAIGILLKSMTGFSPGYAR